MRVSALMMESADNQRSYGQAIGNFRQSLENLLERQKEVQTILRDREILVNRVLRLSQKRPSDKEHEKHAAKLDEASRELGACETALKQEEAALAGVKARTLQEALGMRLRAQEDLGMLYVETAKEGIELLEQLDMEAIMTADRGRPWSPARSPLASPAMSPSMSPRQVRGHNGLPPVDDIPSLNGTEDEEIHQRQRTHSNAQHSSMAVPPAVPEEEEPQDTSDDEVKFDKNTVAHRAAAQKHKRGPSSEYGGTDKGAKKKGGLLGSIGRLFKSRESNEDDREGKPTKKSGRKGAAGWETSIERNVAIQGAINKKAAQTERPWSPSRGRRDSASSDEMDKRKLVKVVNKKRPAIWTPDPTTDAQPKTKPRKRADSFSGTAPDFTLPMYHNPRKAMSDSGLDAAPAKPVKVKKKKKASPDGNLTRSPSSATAVSTATVKKTAKRSTVSSATPADVSSVRSADMQPQASLLSVVDDPNEPSPASRKYLTSPANNQFKTNEGMKRTKSTKSVASSKTAKAKPASMFESPRSDMRLPDSGTGEGLTTLALPNAASYRHAGAHTTQSTQDDLTTLSLPSASASRAYVAGSTLTLPTAPPPVSSTPQQLEVPELNRPQMKRSASTNSGRAGAVSKRHSQQPGPTRSPSSPLKPDASIMNGRPQSVVHEPVRGREMKAKPNGILHSPGQIVRSMSPESTVSRRKSVRIQEGDTPFPSVNHSHGPPDSIMGGKGKNRATEDEMATWAPPLRRGNVSSDEDDDDIAEYRRVS